MNIFEDLIEELKEENLLEETVTEVHKNKLDGQNTKLQTKQTEDLEAFAVNQPSLETNGEQTVSPPVEEPDKKTADYAAPIQPSTSESGFFDTSNEPSEKDFETGFSLSDFSDELSFKDDNVVNQVEFYKKRATDEVTSLQMVEHVLSGVERDFLNTTPVLYDDLEVKKSLHNFLQYSNNVNSPEHAHAEFLLMQETETWYSALSQKDKNISVHYLRRYCETTRPVLSSQALAALARFYRNAPFSESVRSKFDLVMTRYFAREAGGDIRQMLLTRDEIIDQLNDFYADWSSIPLYATEEDESNIVIAAIKFEDFMSEAEATTSLDELVAGDFFNRLKNFKESTHENFFAPLITATSIESNIRIGNRYLELLLNEKSRTDVESLEEKYGFAHSQLVSEVVCKTISIANVFEGKFTDAEIVREKTPEPAIPAVNQVTFEKQDLNKKETKPVKNSVKEQKASRFKVNKGLLIATVAIVVISFGLYMYVEYFNPPPKLSDKVKVVNLENSSLKEYIEAARLQDNKFMGVTNSNWDILSKEKKEEFLRKIISVGGDKGFARVSLVNSKGKSVGYATPEEVQVYNP